MIVGGRDAEGFAFGDGADAVFEVEADGFGGESLEGLVDGFAAEAEGAVVHGDHEAGVEVEEGADGLFGAGVDGAVGVGEVGADGEQGDVGVEARADLVKAGEVGGVAGVVEGGAGGLVVVEGGDGVAAEVAVGVGEEARAPVLAGGQGDAEAGWLRGGQVDGVPPAEGVDGGEGDAAEEVVDAGGDDGGGRGGAEGLVVADDLAQGGEVEVVHVRVGDEDEVDGREVGEADAGVTLAAEEDVAAGDLEEEGGVADEGDAEPGGRDRDGFLGRAGDGVGVAFADQAEELAELGEGPRAAGGSRAHGSWMRGVGGWTAGWPVRL